MTIFLYGNSIKCSIYWNFFILMGNIFSNFTQREKKTLLASSLMALCHVGSLISSFLLFPPEENFLFACDLICKTDVVSKS